MIIISLNKKFRECCDLHLVKFLRETTIEMFKSTFITENSLNLRLCPKTIKSNFKPRKVNILTTFKVQAYKRIETA